MTYLFYDSESIRLRCVLSGYRLSSGTADKIACLLASTGERK